MTARRRELARADRVLPGLWRLRLPLPWPGVPHGNAWAIAAGNGIVLVDWMNVTAGNDSDIFGGLSGEILREGYAYVGVSAQAVGVNFLNSPSGNRPNSFPSRLALRLLRLSVGRVKP